MNRTILCHLAFWLASLPVFAQEPDRSKPAELVALQETWQRARKAATDPVDRKYREALEALRTRFTKAGKLDEALVVDREIKSLSPPTANSKSTSGSQSTDTAALRALLVSGPWNWYSNSDFDGEPTLRIEFHQDGRTNWKYAVKWELVGSQLKVFRNAELYWVFDMDVEKMRGRINKADSNLKQEKSLSRVR